MMDNMNIVRVVVIGLVLAVALPIPAYLLADGLSNHESEQKISPKEKDSSAVESALLKENQTLPEEDRLQDLKVESVEKHQSIWYIATVSYSPLESSEDSATYTAVALVGDFRDSADEMTVLLKPDETFQYGNISNGMGVPYDIIELMDKKGKELDEGRNE